MNPAQWSSHTEWQYGASRVPCLVDIGVRLASAWSYDPPRRLDVVNEVLGCRRSVERPALVPPATTRQRLSTASMRPRQGLASQLPKWHPTSRPDARIPPALDRHAGARRSGLLLRRPWCAPAHPDW